MCSREAQHSNMSDSTDRTEAEPRRNSIPLMKTAAKHLLAYLPRPQQESSCQPPNTLKVPMSLCLLLVYKRSCVGTALENSTKVPMCNKKYKNENK